MCNDVLSIATEIIILQFATNNMNQSMLTDELVSSGYIERTSEGSNTGAGPRVESRIS